jgi:predicted dehydrogenase
MNISRTLPVLACSLGFTLCGMPANGQEVRLMTLDPGHFHAGLVQKFMYPQVSPIVHVYAPGGAELTDHLKRVEGFNARAENPTTWQLKVYTGPDYLDRMIKEKPGNLVVISGNNKRKAEYLDRSIKARINVLADKPMAINPSDFKKLRSTFAAAEKNKVLLYDVMTERHEITSMLQRELAQFPEVFGTLDKGSLQDPAVVMESVHHYKKEVAGKPLVRPAWFFDVEQQGEAVPDVGTHLVDLVQWECFPDQIIDWKKDIKVLAANRWPTLMTLQQFKAVTGREQFPDYLKKDVNANGELQVYQNGDVTYSIRGVHAKVAVMWKYEAPPGTKDTHFSRLRGTRSELVIRQGAEQNFSPILYVEPRNQAQGDIGKALQSAIAKIAVQHPGVDIKKSAKGWQVVIPEKYNVGHEAHFTSVTAKFLDYLANGTMPAWEVPNMIAKYYVTTEAHRLAHKKK